MLPAYMLRQLYVKGSLKNLKEADTVKAFAFTLKNRLGTGTIKGQVTLMVDNEQIPNDLIVVKAGGQTFSVIEVLTKPCKFNVGDSIEFVVNKNGGLSPGQHKLLIMVNTIEFGKGQFDVTDTVS